MKTILAISIILIYIIICFIAYFVEKRNFNNGICPKCGNPLKHFDDCFCGDQGWTCDNCGYTTWISWFKIKD